MAFQLIYPRRNDALRTNPPAGDAHITTHASDWLWAVFALMLLFWFVSLGWAYSVRPYHPPLPPYSEFFLRAADIIGFFTSFPSLSLQCQRSRTLLWHLTWGGLSFAQSLTHTPPVKFSYALVLLPFVDLISRSSLSDTFSGLSMRPWCS